MIVYCCADLIFATKIRSTAESLGIVTRPARHAAMLQARLDRIDDGKPNDPVTAVIVDLEAGGAGLAMIEQVKRHDAAIRVVAFGPHVDTDALESARRRGADATLPRGAFTADLPRILQRLAQPFSD